MTEGIYTEIKLLKDGTTTFMKSKLQQEFIVNQDLFHKNVLKIYEEHTEHHDDEFNEFKKNTADKFEQTFGRARTESENHVGPIPTMTKPNSFGKNNYQDEEDDFDDVEELDDE
jgi:hypothetical protein